MKCRQFKGFKDIYPESIHGTSRWFFGQWTPCTEAYEVPEYNGNIQMFEYYPENERLNLLTEIALKEAGDLINVRIVKEPFMLVKCEMQDDKVDFLWPFRKHLQLEENETLDFIEGEQIITSKWIEDPDYREEVIIRRMSDGEIVERMQGCIVEMPDGTRWNMTE